MFTLQALCNMLLSFVAIPSIGKKLKDVVPLLGTEVSSVTRLIQTSDATKNIYIMV